MPKADKAKMTSRDQAAVEISRINALSRVGIAACNLGAIALIAMAASHAVEALAGKTTFADIGISFLGKLGVSKALAWTFGICGTGYGWRQRALRAKENERQGARIKRLEAAIDERRSSSNLDKRGRTPED